MDKLVVWECFAHLSPLQNHMKATGNRIDSQTSACSARIRAKTWYRSSTVSSRALIWPVSKISKMERALRFGPMAATTMVCSALESRKARGATSGPMVQSTRECGARTRWAATGAFSGLTVATSRDRSRTVSCTAMEYMYGKMVVVTKATTATTRSMVRAPTHTPMVASTVATGTTECSMVLAGSSMQRTLTNARGSGRAANLRTGSRMIKHKLLSNEDQRSWIREP